MAVISPVLWLRLIRRALTSAGNTVALPVTATATTVTWTFTRAEPDTSYGVSACPSWLTTVAWTTKNTGSLVLSFGTAAPANATVDLTTYRSE